MVPRRWKVRSMAMTGVTPLPPVQNSTLGGGGSGRTNSPWGRAKRTIVPGSRPRTRWVESRPFGHGLDGDGDVALIFSRLGGDGVGPPRPAPVDLDADAHVLPGQVVERPAPSGLDHQGGGVLGLGDDLDQLPPDLSRRPQGVDEVEVVVRKQGSGHAGQHAPGQIDAGQCGLDPVVRYPAPHLEGRGPQGGGTGADGHGPGLLSDSAMAEEPGAQGRHGAHDGLSPHV